MSISSDFLLIFDSRYPTISDRGTMSRHVMQ